VYACDESELDWASTCPCADGMASSAYQTQSTEQFFLLHEEDPQCDRGERTGQQGIGGPR
jgi:hypothetical protein